MTRGDVPVSPSGVEDVGGKRVSTGSDHAYGYFDGSEWTKRLASIYAPFSLSDSHALRDYAHLYSISSPEILQLTQNARTVLTYLMHGPPKHQIVSRTEDEANEASKAGSSLSIMYRPDFQRKENPLAGIIKKNRADASDLRGSIHYLFQHVVCRPPTAIELRDYTGILTHPSWLIAHSTAMENHAIHRGIWIRTKLLGGAIPDIPITVDAKLPEEPESTLRHRMRMTEEKQCVRCHRSIDPLGLPFERYNHLGVHRELEQGKPVDTTGAIVNSGVPGLDGPVKGPYELIEKLANTERVHQVFVRFAFRYWMGRNETIQDAPVIRAAYKAYLDNDGSMNALVKSLLLSDSFLYRLISKES